MLMVRTMVINQDIWKERELFKTEDLPLSSNTQLH